MLMYIAWSNIMSKKLRSTLTITGVVIGIGAIFFLLSFGIGLQELVSKQVIGDKSIKSIEVSTPSSRILKLDEESVNKIKRFPHAEKVGTQFSSASVLNYKGGQGNSIVYGVDSSYVDMSSIKIAKGRQLKEEDNTHAVISKGALKGLGITNYDEMIGKQINVSIPLNEIPEAKDKPIKGDYEIVGITDSETGTEIYIPGHVFSRAGVTTYKQVKIIADNKDNIPQLRKQIESIGFQTASPVDTLDEINKIFKFFNLMLVGFGAIGMIVAVLGMFNTLTISLLERTQEIGLMMALGGRNSDMRKLFIFEATLLSYMGASIGVLLAIVSGFIVDVFMNRMARGRGVAGGFSLFSTPAWLILGLILFMLLVGLAVVYFPARRAQKINPIDALRRE